MRRKALAASGFFVVAVALAASSSTSARPVAFDDPCVSALVHYEPTGTPAMPRTPWVAAGRPGRQIVGYLFYYGSSLGSTRRLTIPVGGLTPEGWSTKILWVPRVARSSTLTIIGQRLDAPGRFHQEQGVAQAGRTPVFPSIVDVPAAGCWRLTLRNGRGVSARLAVVAI